MKPSPSQRQIIEHPNEPLRIVAGAGAGKTTTMALRLAALVETGTVEAEQALGITFTNKAADQLADRLRQQLPDLAQAGRTVPVATYHGFAHSLLMEFGALVGVERKATLLGGGYQRELLRRALAGGSYSVLDLSAAARRVEDLSALWGHLSDNLITPARLLTSAGDEVAEARAEMASVLVRYVDLKAELDMVDYGDLIGKAVQLTTEHPEIAQRIRERYQVVLLDEFQDTNAAQRVLLLSLFGNGFPVTAVGDTNQTIYEWRGASIANFDSFPQRFTRDDGTPALTLDLKVNYRSDQLILDVANKVEARISLGEDGTLVAGPEADDGFVGLARLADREAEAAFIADEILQLSRDGAKRWSDITCLFRRNADIAAVREALEAVSIPVEVVSLGGLLDVPVVEDLHAWLRVLGDPDDAVALVRLLTRGRYRLGLGDMAPLVHLVSANTVRDDAAGAPGWALLEAVDALESVEGLSPDTASRIEHFRGMFRELLQEAQGVSLVELCLRVLDKTGFWQEIEALNAATRLSARLNLYRFLDLAEQWSPLEGRPSLRSFLEYLDLLREDATTDELDTARLSGENAVALMTIHRAKGLEWPVVFLPVVVEKVLPYQGGQFDDPISQARSLPYEMRIDRDSLPTLSEKQSERREQLRALRQTQEWRVAYVAATRAQHRLYLTCAHWYGGVNPREPSDLYNLARSVPGVEVLQEVELGPRPAIGRRPDPTTSDHVFGNWEEALRTSLADPQWPAQEAERRDIGTAYAEAMDQMGMELGDAAVAASSEAEEPFRTSVTGLVTYATCPKRFFWSEIDRLPRRPSPAARRGVELHRKIELHNRGAMALEYEAEDLYDFTPDEGSEPVAGAFNTYISSRFASIRPTFVEVPFDLSLEPGRIRGRIDAIYTDGSAWEIVDFKSGRNRHDPARRVQLEAYAVAATDVRFGAEPPQEIKVTFAYFGNGLEEVSESVDEAWLEDARRHLDELTAGAGGDEFTTTPSEACHNCDFLRFCDAGKAFVNA